MKQIVGYNLIGSVCDECNQLADWRVVNRETGIPIYAACREHKPIVRARYLCEQYGEPLPMDHPDAIESGIAYLERRAEGLA